jgi:hypothetical protein
VYIAILCYVAFFLSLFKLPRKFYDSIFKVILGTINSVIVYSRLIKSFALFSDLNSLLDWMQATVPKRFKSFQDFKGCVLLISKGVRRIRVTHGIHMNYIVIIYFCASLLNALDLMIVFVLHPEVKDTEMSSFDYYARISADGAFFFGYTFVFFYLTTKIRDVNDQVDRLLSAIPLHSEHEAMYSAMAPYHKIYSHYLEIFGVRVSTTFILQIIAPVLASFLGTVVPLWYDYMKAE